MTEQVKALSDFADQHPNVRLFLVFHHREEGLEADDLSKAFLPTDDSSDRNRLEWASECLQRRGFEPLTVANRLPWSE